MRSALILGLFLLPLAAACHENGCNQPPFYECGTYDREERIFCYYILDGRYVPALEHDVLNITLPPWSATPVGDPIGAPEATVGYLWLEPLRNFIEDPYQAPFPRLLFIETNDVDGLQAKPFKCGTFVWYAFYPGCWLGPFNILNKPPDQEPVDALVRTVADMLT